MSSASLDYRRLREQVPIEEILGRMSWEATERRGDQLRGACPLCSPSARSGSGSEPASQLSTTDSGETTVDHRSFSVNLRRNIFQCFRCKRSGTILDLWSHHRSLSIHAAGLEIRERMQENKITPTSNQQPFKRTRPTS